MSEEGITILGTAGDSQVVGRQARASGGFLILTPDNQLHIDPGPGSLVQLARHDLHPRETTAIIVSHQHVTHACDTNAIISVMTHNGMDKKGVLITNDVEEQVVDSFHRSLVEKVAVLKAGGKIAVNDVDLRAVSLNHYDAQALGYVFYTPQYVLGYVSDTVYSDELAKQYNDVNVLIVNCKYPDAYHEGDHLCTEDVIRLLQKVSPQLVILTHFGVKMLNADPLAQARLIQRETKIQTIAAKDGLHISPASYNAKQRQKTLSLY